MTGIFKDDQAAGRYLVRGDMSFDTVSDLWQRSQLIFANAGHKALQIDLGGVQTFDSAGLALLVAWKRYAQSRTQSFTLIRVPHKLLEMAKANNLAALLGLDTLQA
jgi:phospholipid transport system transporter-binding protein